MEEQTDILKQLKKATLPGLPNGFFDTFSDDLIHLIDLQESTSGLLEGLSLKRFENDFKSNISIDEKNVELLKGTVVKMSVKSNKAKQTLLWVAGIAACFLIYFSLPFLTISKTEIAETITSEELLLAYLDEDDLVDFIIDAESFQTTDSIVYVDELLYEELENEIFDYINELQ